MNFKNYKPTLQEMQAMKSYKLAFQYSPTLQAMSQRILAKRYNRARLNRGLT